MLTTRTVSRLALGPALLLVVSVACGGCASAKPKANPAASGGSHAKPGPSTTAPAATLSASLVNWHLPAPVSRAAVMADGTNLIIAGGLATGDVSTNAVVQVVATTGASTKLGTLAVAVHDLGGAVLGGQIYVFGGGASSTLGTVQRFSEGRSATAPPLPRPRSDGQVVSDSGKAWIVGGFDGKAMDADILTTTTGEAESVTGTLAVPVRYPAVAWGAGALWVAGGQLGTDESTKTGGQTDAVQRFDPATGTTQVVAHLPTPLGHASAVYLAGSIWVLGGQAGTAPSDRIYRIDPATSAVTAVGNLPGPRSDAGVAVIGDTAYLVGGETTDPAHPLDSVVALRQAS